MFIYVVLWVYSGCDGFPNTHKLSLAIQGKLKKGKDKFLPIKQKLYKDHEKL